MLSYRHAFHAGNHADVLKHLVYAEVLAHMVQKEKSFWIIDTHAGAGLYSLTQGFATKNIEFSTGIERLLKAKHLPQTLAHFVAIIRQFNPQNSLDFYPGSPKIAANFLREQDKMHLFELHPNDHTLLTENFAHQNKLVKIDASDGFASLKRLLPPPSRRAVVLIDPPYEEKHDYQRVISATKDALARFATGSYLIWYPLLQRPEPLEMIAQLKKLDISNWLDISLSVERPSAEGFGMYGSGMFVINPPWKLAETLEQCMPTLLALLKQDESASFNLTVQSH